MSEYTDDAYQILGIPPTATEREIKTAYRKLALVYHPDRQSDDKQREIATTKFVKIANAYEILTDSHLRAEYDERYRSSSSSYTSQQPSSNTNTTTSSSTTNPSTEKTSSRSYFKPSRNKNTPSESELNKSPPPFRYHFSDPYEVFKRDFRDQFGIDYPGAKYDWIDFNEPIVLPATAANTTKMITNGPEESQTKRKGFNLFRRKPKDTLDPSKNDRQLVLHNDGKKDLALSATTCTDLVVAEKRNNRPVSMDVQTSKDPNTGITTTRTTITRPDGSTETVTMKTGIPGKAPQKAITTKPLPQLTNGPNKLKLTTNSSSSSNTQPSKSTSSAMVPSNRNKTSMITNSNNISKIGRIGK